MIKYALYPYTYTWKIYEDAKSFIKNESFKSRLIITVCALISAKCIKRVKSFIMHNWAKIGLKYCLLLQCTLEQRLN